MKPCARSEDGSCNAAECVGADECDLFRDLTCALRGRCQHDLCDGVDCDDYDYDDRAMENELRAQDERHDIRYDT